MKKKWLLIIPVVGVFILYLIYRHNKSAAGSSAGDSSGAGLPGVIVTGGGSYMPSSMGSAPPIQTYDSGNFNVPTDPGYSHQMQPSAASSGVPSYTSQAQEFNTGNPVAAPHPANAAPSFYNTNPAAPPSGADLNYQAIGSDRVAATTGPGKDTPGASYSTLESFLQSDLRAYEIQGWNQIGNKQQLSTDPNQLGGILGGEANAYCGLHPEACSGSDQASIISGLTNAYKDFIGQAAQVPGVAPSAPATAAAPAGTGPLVNIGSPGGQANWVYQSQVPTTTTPTTGTLTAEQGAEIARNARANVVFV